MNLSVENVLLFALVVCALYLLVNRCGCKEGMKNSDEPENSSDCERLCEENKVGLSIGQQCVYDKRCEKGGAGCKIGGITLCRICDNDETTDYSPCADYSPPSHPPPPPPPPPSGEKSLKQLGITTEVNNKTMFDITILDLDPKKHRQIRYRLDVPKTRWWGVNTKKGSHIDGYILLTDPEKIALLDKLYKYTGITAIGVSPGIFWYDYKVHFYGKGDFRFWDDNGELYSKYGAITDGHDVNYSSTRPKIRALYSNNACEKYKKEVTIEACKFPKSN